jgi:hypothetical protein
MDYSKFDWNAAAKGVLNDLDKQKAPINQGVKVDLTKYFGLTLPDGVNSGERIFRILPLTPNDFDKFYEVIYFHSLKVGKRYAKLYDPAQDNERSPINDMYRAAMAGTSDDQKLAYRYKSKPYYIVRGIERGKESEGVKFWRFPSTDNGIMDKLKPIITRLSEKNPGDVLWRPDEGRDLIISLIRDKKGYIIATQVLPDDKSPLSADQQQAEAWINDPLTAKDIFKKKSVEYLTIVAKGGEPVWDNESKSFIAKAESGSVMYTTQKFAEPIDDMDDISASDAIHINTEDLPF